MNVGQTAAYHEKLQHAYKQDTKSLSINPRTTNIFVVYYKNW